MKAVEWSGQTTILNPPRGWDNGGDNPKCGGLPVEVLRDEHGTVMRSMWRPSREDLEILNDGGYVVLSVLGTMHPPVALYTELHCEEMP
jgi:hypothetical protein